MRRVRLFFFFFVWIFISMAQTANCYRIYLNNKDNSPYSIDNPLEYLSQRAIDKRTRFNIPITEQDFPVNPEYKQHILSLEFQMKLLSVSKWMNTMTVYCPDSSVVDEIERLAFVDSVLPVASYSFNSKSERVDSEEWKPIVRNTNSVFENEIDYGDGWGQIAIHNGHRLHEEGFRGDGMLIAVLDGGYYGIESCTFYQTLVDEGRMLGRYVLVPDVAEEVSLWDEVHGTNVISVMAANANGELVGTAPMASYALIHTEWGGSEQLIEEDFWANGAEIADSIGADVINSSLGYRSFPDFPEANITYEEIDGRNSIASRCATILGEKGVIVCIAAGNDGDKDWYYIGRPADAFNILCVGACQTDSVIAEFSSRGYTYDGRVKPDITSMGVSTYCYYPNDYLYTSNGTSLACPVAAGLSACLWQAMPEYSASQIMQIIRESGHLYHNPNPEYGYGIPDFYKAYADHVGVDYYNPLKISVFPNPTADKLQLTNPERNIRYVRIYNTSGQLVLQQPAPANAMIEISVNNLPKGFYVGLATTTNQQNASFKFLKN